MKLSAPAYQLKRQAKRLAREKNIPLHAALDYTAVKEGFASWSLLAVRHEAISTAGRVFRLLQPGDLLLVGARPGHGKTLFSLELAIEAMKAGHRAVFFSLEYTHKDILDRFRALGVEPAGFDHLFQFDGSDGIDANHIIAELREAPYGSFVAIDYLQLLDQKRTSPELIVQLGALKSFARQRGVIFAFISQIDRTYDPSSKPFPDIADIRMPNPLDPGVFDKICFLNNGQMQFQTLN